MRKKLRFLQGCIFAVLFLALTFGAAAQSPIAGQYRFIEDKPAGLSAAAGGEILLSVTEDGRLLISATKPGDALTTSGAYRLNGNRITISFPELGKSVQDGPWRIEGDILFLPLQFIGDWPGTSSWRRIPSGKGPIQRFYDVLDREVRSGGKSGDALRLAAEEARSLSLSAGGGDRSLRIRRYSLWTEDAGCTLEFEDGHQEALLVETGSPDVPPALRQLMSQMALDPRTHIPAQPHTAPDDPQSKSAVLFAPFNVTPFYAFAWAPPGPGVSGFTARVASHKEWGEDLKFLRDTLKDRNYDVEILDDERATPLALHDAILEHPPAPGFIYLSTHGGVQTLDDEEITRIATGVCLGLVSQENEIHQNSARVQEIIRRTVPPGYYDRETSVGQVHAKVIAGWARKTEGMLVAYLVMTNHFFDKIREEGADFGSSFVYANACYTAKNRGLVDSIKAKAFLGNLDLACLPVVVAQARWILTRLSKRTFSLREALGLLHHIAKTRHRIFPEDDLLQIVSQEACENLALFGQDGRFAQIPNFDVLYLCWMARWSSKDPEAGAQALEDTYNEYWKKMHFSRLKSPFANAGVRGSHMPTEEEVKFARHLVSGVPEKPGGRFTLNDKDPGKNKAKN